EVGLELNDGVAALTGDTLHRTCQQKLETVREKGAAEELGRFSIFVRPFSEIYLPQVGCELRLLVTAARHVLMGCHHFAPRLEIGRCRAFDGRSSALALFGSDLFVEAQAQ